MEADHHDTSNESMEADQRSFQFTTAFLSRTDSVAAEEWPAESTSPGILPKEERLDEPK